MDVPLGACLFHRSLLDRWLLQDPHLGSLDGTYLLLSLLAKATPAFSYRATAIRYEPDGPASLPDDPGRRDDLARLHTRFVGRPFPAASRLVGFEALQRAVQRVAPRRSAGGQSQVQRRDGVTEYLSPPCSRTPSDRRRAGSRSPWTPRRWTWKRAARRPQPTLTRSFRWWCSRPRSRGRTACPGRSASRTMVRTCCGSTAALSGARRRSGSRRGSGRASSTGFSVPSQDDAVIVNLPIPRPSAAGPIVVQATHGMTPPRVVIESARLFATRERLPLVAARQFMAENEQFQTTLDTVQQEHAALTAELERSRKRVREMRSSRVWQLGALYWRLHQRLNEVRGRLGRRPGRGVRAGRDSKSRNATQVSRTKVRVIFGESAAA